MDRMIKRSVRIAVLILAACLTFLSADAPDIGDHITIRLMTLGQGDPVYIWFGHSAIVVDDEYQRTSLLYDYGVFDFQQENFYTNFAMGRLIYSIIVSPAQAHVYLARQTERNLRVATLDLPSEAKEEVATFLARDVLPGNNTYLYHHYYDNCSTRIRDIIDAATGGQFKAWAVSQEGSMTYREHVRRHTGHSFFMDWLLNFLQGPLIDRPITRWDDMFLPEELERSVLEFSYTDPQGDRIPLAASYEVVTQFASRPPVPEAWYPLWPKGLLLGIFLAAVSLASQSLRFRGVKGSSWGILNAFLGIFFGIFGTVLPFMMLFTDHDVTRGNLNLFMVNPLWLIIGVLGILHARGKADYTRQMVLLWRVLGVLSLVMLALRLFMEYPQQNMLTISIVLPLVLIQGQWWRWKRRDP